MPKISPSSKPPLFVVYVTFPNSNKEYCYLCNLSDIVQGSTVVANGTQVKVVRTAAYDPRAVRYVNPLPNQDEILHKARKAEIISRLRTLQSEQQQLDLWQKLATKNAEAKKLYLELKNLLKK